MEDMPKPSEALRKKLLAEELKLRKSQPPHWAKTKYRKYALLRRPDEPLLKIKKRRKAKRKKVAKKKTRKKRG